MSDEQPSAWAAREGALLLVVALGCLAFQLWVPTTHVAEGDYQAVAAVLQAEARPGDVVLLSPWWTERARLYVPESVPVVGYLGSDADELVAHPRIWVLAEPDLPRSGQAAFQRDFGPNRQAVGAERRFGHLSLRLYTNGRYRPTVFSANSWLERAKVYLEAPQGRAPCQWTGHGHQCPNGHAVVLEWHEVHFQPLQCLVFDAPGGSSKLVLELEGVPAAASARLRTGYIWERASYRAGVTDSQVGLEVNGETMVRTIPAGVELLHQLDGPSAPAGATVRVWVSSPNPTARQLCVELTGLGAAP